MSNDKYSISKYVGIIQSRLEKVSSPQIYILAFVIYVFRYRYQIIIGFRTFFFSVSRACIN